MSKLARQAILILMAAASWKVVRAEITKPEENRPGVVTEARCVPNLQSGRVSGYRCFQIQKGSRFEKLGLQDGDVIKSIDGKDLDDPMTALEKLGRLSATHPEKVSLTLERDGKELTRTYDPESKNAPAALPVAPQKKQVKQ